MMRAKIGEWREIPGPESIKWLQRAKRYLFTTTVDSDIIIAGYEGPYVFDPDRNCYLDFASGVGVNSFGGGEKALAHLWETIGSLRYSCGACGDIGSDWFNLPAIKAAQYIEKSITSLVSDRNKVYFASSGERANMAALDLAWNYGGANNFSTRTVVCFEGAFHGREFLTKLLDPRKPERFEHYPLADYPVIRAPFPSASLKNPLKTLRNFMDKLSKKERIGVDAVIFEPIQGEGGIVVPDSEALRWWVDAWRNEGVNFIIADEIQTGMGRTGKLMGYEHFGVKPDVVTLSKCLGSGVPVAVMIGPPWADWEKLGRQSESFSGTPLSSAAAHATLQHVLEHGVLEKNQELGEYLGQLLLSELGLFKCIKEIRGKGLMWGVEFCDALFRDKVKDHAEHMGLRVVSAGFSEDNPTIRIMPTYAVNKEELKLGVETLARAVCSTIKDLNR